MTPHKWTKSTLSHGNYMCTVCCATDLEIGASGDMNNCEGKEQTKDTFDLMIENARAMSAEASTKFPQPNYVLLKVAEEAGEVVRAGIHQSEGRVLMGELVGEITQLVAMLHRLWTEGDETIDLAPARTGYDAL